MVQNFIFFLRVLALSKGKDEKRKEIYSIFHIIYLRAGHTSTFFNPFV